LVAPGAAGFRFCGPHAWLNAFLFPISRERFVADLRRLDSTQTAAIMNPGDTFTIVGDDVTQLRGASALAVTDEDDSAQLRFVPTAPIPDLCDPNPDGYSMPALAAKSDALVRHGLGRLLDGCDPLVQRYRALAARYAVGLVFPDTSVSWYHFNLAHVPPRLEDHGDADVVHRIAASALVAWMERKRSFFSVRAYSRRFSTLYRLGFGDGSVHIVPQTLPDLLMYYLLHVAPGSELAAKQRIDWELQELRQGNKEIHA
jgi:hypothetical protein